MNYPQLVLIAVVVGVIAGFCGLALHAIFHLSNNLVGVVAIVSAVVLVQPIYNGLKNKGILKKADFTLSHSGVMPRRFRHPKIHGSLASR